VKKPYLIQRGIINKPFADHNARLSEAVNLDYMGSAEFEFGALPKSLRRIQQKVDSWTKALIPDIQYVGINLRLFSALKPEELEVYSGYLKSIYYEDSIHLKENARFTDLSKKTFKFSSDPDFWWDIENDIMWTFHKLFSNRLIEHVANSIAYMESQKPTK